jgi:predicted deacetylase
MLLKLNVSIHDITRSNIEMVEDLLDFLQNFGIEKISFLLIPYYHEKESLTQIKDWLSSNIKDNEVILHGYTHKSGKFNDYRDFLTNQEGEFAFYNDIENRVVKGLKILSEIGYYPEGFIPPAWLMKKDDFKILKKYGFKFTTDRRFIYDLVNDKKIFSPVLSFGGRGFLEKLSIFTFKKQVEIMKILKVPIFRVAIHPVDVLNKEKLILLTDFFKTNEYELISLKESLNLIKN